MLSPSRFRLAAGLAALVSAACLAALAPNVVAPVAAEAATVTGARIDAVLLTPYEARLVRLVNHARTTRGLPVLTVTPCAEDFARGWTKVMARQDRLYHNPNLAVLWDDRHCERATYLAENVGYASGSADVVFTAYMNSPHHKENILSRQARFIGIGSVARSDGRVYNTMNFTNASSADYGAVRVLGQRMSVR